MKAVKISMLALTVLLAGLWTRPAYALALGLKDEGVGIYTDASVASQVSTFTLNKNQVSCGVGTVNADGTFGPFEMLMYSLSIDSYVIDRSAKTVTASGKMRSITRVSGVIVLPNHLQLR